MGHFSHSLVYLLCFLLAVPGHAQSQNKGRLLKWIDTDTVKIDINGNAGSGNGSIGDDELLKRLKGLGSGKGSGGNSGNSSGLGNGNGNGSGGAGAGSGSGGPGPGAGDSGKDTSNRGGEPPGGGDKTGDGNKPVVFDKFWPMCVLFDTSVSNQQANEIVKGLHDKAAQCRVSLYVEPVTVAPVPGDPGTFNALSQSTCNMGAIGFPTASVLLANPDPLAAAKMCDVKKEDGSYDEAVAGCAQVRSGGLTADQEKIAQGSKSFAQGSGDGIIPSVIVPNGYNSGVAMHEAIGHSQMGWPNHEPPKTDDAGLGIGRPNDKYASGGLLNWFKETLFASLGLETAPPRHTHDVPIVSSTPPKGKGPLGDGFNSVGCAQMYARAFPNTKKVPYVPNQDRYFQQWEKPWPFGKPLWGGGGPPSGDGGQPPPIVRNERPKPPKEEIFMDDNVAKAADPSTGSIDARHKKKPGEATENSLVSLRKGGGSRTASEGTGGKPLNLPPEKGGKGGSESLTFNDNVKKGGDTTGDSSSGSGSSGSSLSSTSMSDTGGGGESLTFDDSVAKGSSGSTGPGPSSRNPASTGAGSPIGGQAGEGLSNSLDDDFFKALVKAEAVRSRRTKGSTLRSFGKEQGGIAVTRVPTASKSKGSSSARQKGSALRK